MLLIVPLPVHIALIVIGIISLFLLLHLLNRFILKPAVQKKNDIEAPPPTEGYQYPILLDDSSRIKKIAIGQTDSDIKTRLQGIKENHIILEIRKEQGMEEYTVKLKPGGAVFLKPPHTMKFEQIKNPVTFESREFIGNPASIRLASIVNNGRAVQYVAFDLSVEFIIDRSGRERMKFFLTLKSIYPSLNIQSRNKKGIYSFGRVQAEQDEN